MLLLEETGIPNFPTQFTAHTLSNQLHTLKPCVPLLKVKDHRGRRAPATSLTHSMVQDIF
jgi:hypothetical protein